MAREGPYEIVPTEEIRDLKVEIGELKKKSEKDLRPDLKTTQLKWTKMEIILLI